MKTILFLIGAIVFNCRDVYAYGYSMGRYIDNPYLAEEIWLVLALIFFGIIFYAMKERETNKDSNEGKDADESLKNFLKHEQEKPKK